MRIKEIRTLSFDNCEERDINKKMYENMGWKILSYGSSDKDWSFRCEK